MVRVVIRAGCEAQQAQKRQAGDYQPRRKEKTVHEAIIPAFEIGRKGCVSGTGHAVAHHIQRVDQPVKRLTVQIA
ncbi:hypothetical protein DmAi_04150 [Acetobacter persici]|uniref:Uncharacterized protein n=1 Tax=Acetobacter persici TaxID=1076596 RepID=A0A6V8I6W5_9PROT|nr:hypothetical protein DmAi_04150 [Acetobacter persici]